ncbi:XRE family transcriptional regulator [Streptomyces sp. CB01881]|uniref:helix-turn-helix domain-containing protein n=1 Tax=Streptomyces sp. CB01881 TaxID=2078691 RepID=UPI0011DF5465|nr:helix-turn-helix transcriptional regulator [Streptomyces sp. CB01881]TYC66626.1 XRE family transcriptional regulator [Streptomyces sp. CB01881]
MRETDEVAQLLRELKSRSGLSYGALAKRLHLSTSALHRYCNGDVMPTEFAPLEHLSRLCEATPQERVELYRLWVIAHASRGSRTPPVPEPMEPPATPPTEATPEATLPTIPETEAEAEATRDTGGAAEAAPVPAATGADPDRGLPVPPQRRARHQGALALVTVTVVLATVGAVATGLRTHTGGDTASARATAVGSPAGSPAPGVHGSSSASSSPASAGAGASGPAGGTDTSANAPLTVSVHPSGWDTACDKYLVNSPPSAVPRPPAVSDVPGWVSRLGAVPGHYQSIEITVQGTGRDTVVLTGLNVRITRIADPLAWNAYSMGEGCGGGVGVRSYNLDLDAARPRPVVTGGSSGLPVKVSEGDPEVIEVTAQTTSHDVSWYLELEWSSGSRQGTLPVDLGHGTPFRTSALKGRPLYVYPIGGQAWEPSPYQR